MSTTYYIANRKRKKECEEFKKFWEEEWFPEITDKLYQFCTGTNGEIVNKDLAESITEDKMCGFSSTPLSDTLFEEAFLTVNKSGVFWHKCEVEGVLLNSLEELIKFFSKKANQETYSLEDQNGRVCTLNDLIRELSGK